MHGYATTAAAAVCRDIPNTLLEQKVLQDMLIITKACFGIYFEKQDGRSEHFFVIKEFYAF